MKNKMCRLNKEQLKIKTNFIDNYIAANNPADGSTFDPNANVTKKSIATLTADINKDIFIQINRAKVHEYLTEYFDKEVADTYIHQLESHDIYCHDESFLGPYCSSISLYPYLLNGLQDFGGEAKAPKHLHSYCGGLINLLFAISSLQAGAVCVSEALVFADYFARKDYGDNYLVTHRDTIEQELQSLIYAINQPASARGFQSVFSNFTIFDKHYFNQMFESFYFPDGSKPNWETVDKLQKFFMKWFNKERTKALLTFPVVTFAMLNDGSEMVDKDYLEFASQELSEGNSFFIYTSNSVDALASCCFDGDTKVLVKIGNTPVLTTFRELTPNKEYLVYHEGEWREGTLIELPSRILYKITVGNKIIRATDNHLHFTDKGLKKSEQLNTNNYLLVASDTYNGSRDSLLSFEDGFIIGSYLARGKIDKDVLTLRGDPKDYQYLKAITKKYNCMYLDDLHTIQSEDNKFLQFIKTFVDSTYAISLDAIEESALFRRGIYDAYNLMDKRNTIDVEKLNVVFLTIGKVSFTKSSGGNHYSKIHAISKEVSQYENVYCFEMKDEKKPYFTLANGIITHNCRLRNAVNLKENDFSYSLGAGGVQTGSAKVITLNMNRFVQHVITNRYSYSEEQDLPKICEELKNQVKLIHKYLIAHKLIYKDYEKAGLLLQMSAGFIPLDKLYVTVGLNGVKEAAEYLGYKISNNTSYKKFIDVLFSCIANTNKETVSEYPEYKLKINTEQTPSESLGVKFAKWDKADGLFVPRDCYTSYLFNPEDESVSVTDQFVLHGKETTSHLDGGVANHVQLEDYPTKETFKKLLNLAAKTGCFYFCFNVKVTICNDCNHIDKHTLTHCSKCGSSNIDYATRIIGLRYSSFK